MVPHSQLRFAPGVNRTTDVLAGTDAIYDICDLGNNRNMNLSISALLALMVICFQRVCD